MTDYMKEAERLVSELIDAAHGTVLNEDQSREDEVRAALLAHIQRGAVPEGWQLVPKAPTEEMLLSGMGDDWPEDVYLRDAYELMLSAAPAPDHFRDAAKMVAAPAGVPMPKPVAYGFGNTAITGHTNRLMMVRIDIPGGDQYAGAFWLPLVLADEAHTYGNAREAAGYAHAIEVIKRLRDSHQTATGECQSDCDFVTAWDSAIDALRGEVKP